MARILLVFICLSILAIFVQNLKLGEHELIHQQTVDQPYLPLYIGKGYDILKGNPLHSQKVDPGFLKQIFNLSYSKNNKTTDGKFVVPNSDQVESVQRTSCSFTSQVSQYKGTTSYQNTLSTKATVSGGYNGLVGKASFSASASYQSMNSETTTNKNIVTHAIGECQKYQFIMGTFSLPPFSTDFVAGIKYSYTNNDWSGFVGSYGTHYAYDVIMGGRAFHETIYTYQSVQKLKSIGVDINVAAKARYAQFYGDTSFDYSNLKNQSDYAEQTEQSSSQLYIGGKPPSNGNISQWANSVTKDSMPITYKLNTISSLFNKVPDFKDISSKIKTSYQNYLSTYCTSVGCSQPSTDCSQPKSSTTTTTQYGPFGGNGGGSFSKSYDSSLNQMNKLFIRSGTFVDQIEIQITDGVRTLVTGAFGGNGGGYNTWSVPSEEIISQIKVSSGSFVDSIQFITNTGTQSPKYGGDGGGINLVTLDTNYRIIGIFGKSGRYLDKIGFIASKAVYPTYCS